MTTPEVREQSRRNFIADAIEVLNRSLDYQTTLASLAWIAVPTIADWCTIDMLEDGKLKRLAVAHVDPAKIEFVKELERRFPPDLDAPTGIANILRTGKPEMFARITDEMIDAAPGDPAYIAMIRQLGLRSYIGVPLRRGDSTVGVITLIMSESGRAYDAGDLALALTLADRASAAIENAHLFRELELAHAHTASERDRLFQLVESAPVAIAVMRGPDLVFEVVNEPFQRTFGKRQLRGLSQATIDPTGAHGAYLREVMASGQRVEQREREVLFDWEQDGHPSVRYFDLAVAPLRDASGRIDGVVSFSLDVTDQVRARKNIEEAHAQAELANRAKDEFLAMLGHELRNPLAPILTALELMELRDPNALQRERTVIARQVRHVVRLVDDLLDVSRITRGAVELHREDLDVADVIAKAIEIASPLLEERGHELITAIPRGELFVHADPVRLAQVVANLVTNAAKYTERKGTVQVTARLEGTRVAIRVRDSGIGIATEALPHVFDTFYQGRQSIDRAQGGLGLGLAIVRSMITAHGGEVQATSDGPGTGSEFVVWLAALPAATRRSHALGTPLQGSRPIRTERILIVDDNVDALHLLADALEQRGFETHTAHDAPSALALAAQVRPQIALLDIGLPVMDGYELGRRLRELDGLREVQLVALTGYGQASDVAQSQEAGFVAHLVKPISLDAVQRTIERLSVTISRP